MRIASSVTSVSWIPSEAVQGLRSAKMAFDAGFTHYDPPPPETLASLEQLRRDDRFRFANELRAWIEVRGGRITAHGHSGKGHIGSTTLRLGVAGVTVPAVPLPDLRPETVVGESWVRFTQTAGGRTGVPAPRRVRRKPYIQIKAPLAWTTLQLTIHADGTSEAKLTGASKFPRHWVYGPDGSLMAKSGLIDFKTWYREAFGANTPWGDADSPAVVTQVESALERELSHSIMRARTKPKIREIADGDVLVRQGDPGDELFLLLDGVLRIEAGGRRITEVGPGAVLGERALLEAGKRTSTLVAVTPCRVAAIAGSQVDPAKLAELAKGHQREYRKS